MRLLDRLRAAADGPLPALPRPVDAACQRWAGLRPRVRLALACVAVLALVAVAELRVNTELRRWGGTPVPVLVAERDLPVGVAPEVRPRRLPPAAVPPGARTEVPGEAVLALALPEGSVLTDAHLDARGAAAGLVAGARAIPIPVEEGWGIVQGAWVDVWALGVGDEPALLIARSRPVVELRADTRGGTALVGLEGDEVRAATVALAAGQLLLAHAPGPGADR